MNMMKLKKPVAMLSLAVAALATTGCASMQESTKKMMGTTAGAAVLGAGIGAGLGVGVAAIASTNLWTGGIVGASVGLLGGGLAGYSAQKCEAEGGKTRWSPSY